jgi:[acyl-carrier-protein] S-malonyltransferase
MAKAEVIRPSFETSFFSNPESSSEIEQLPKKIAFVFPGQGGQFVGMGDSLLEYSAGQEVFQIADTVLPFSLQDICSVGPAHRLNETPITQPAVVATSIAGQKVIETIHPNLKPDIVAGHSLGELSGLVAAGVIDTKTAIILASMRGLFMQEAGKERAGGMGVVLGAQQEQIDEVLNTNGFKGKVYTANKNSLTQTVISGDREKVQEALELFKEEKMAKRAVMLDISIAAHTPFMESARRHFGDVLKTITFQVPDVPVVLNYTNKPSCDPQEIKEDLSEQLTGGVDWIAMTQTMNDFGVRAYVEMGPGNALSGLLKKENIVADKKNILTAKEYMNLYSHE